MIVFSMILEHTYVSKSEKKCKKENNYVIAGDTIYSKRKDWITSCSNGDIIFIFEKLIHVKMLHITDC